MSLTMMSGEVRYFVNDQSAPIGTPPTIISTLDEARRVAASKGKAKIVKSSGGAVWMLEVWENGSCTYASWLAE